MERPVPMDLERPVPMDMTRRCKIDLTPEMGAIRESALHGGLEVLNGERWTVWY